MTSGCPFIAGPSCWDCNGSCWDGLQQLEQPEEPPQQADCDGSAECPAPWHYHGCYSDNGDCDRPESHVIAAETPRNREP